MLSKTTFWLPTQNINASKLIENSLKIHRTAHNAFNNYSSERDVNKMKEGKRGRREDGKKKCIAGGRAHSSIQGGTHCEEHKDTYDKLILRIHHE